MTKARAVLLLFNNIFSLHAFVENLGTLGGKKPPVTRNSASQTIFLLIFFQFFYGLTYTILFAPTDYLAVIHLYYSLGQVLLSPFYR